MSITFPEWTPDTPPRTGMGALLTARAAEQQKSLRERLPSIAVSAAAHGAILYVILLAGITAIKPADEVQTINVSIAAQKVAKPEPPPPVKMERLPDVRQPIVPEIAPPQIDIAAPPAPMAIQAAPPSPPAPTQTNAKPTEDVPTTPPRFDAAYLNNTLPPYPNMSRRLREVGTVMLRVRVSAAGLPLDVQMVKSSGYARLDEVAVPAVKKWKFQPAMRNGAAVEAWVIVPVEFSLGK